MRSAASTASFVAPGRLTLFYSTGDLAGAWQQLVDAASAQPGLVHGESGARVDAAALRGRVRAGADLQIPLDLLLTNAPTAVLMPALVGELADGLSRWERTLALLAAGTAVLAPLDISELASTAQTVSLLTGRRSSATVGDVVLQRADQVVWVDRRSRRDSTAAALRTLALRTLASVERGDEHDMLAQADIGRTILAVIGPDDGARVVQTAARLARQLESGWEVIYAQPPGARYSNAMAREAVQATLKLAATLGARTATIPCLNIAEAVAQYAVAHRCRHLVTGIHAGRGSERWPRRLVELVPDVELTLVPVVQPGWPGPRFSGLMQDGSGTLTGYAAALGGCTAVTTVGLLTHGHIVNVNLALLFLLWVFIVGRGFGRGPAAVASLVGSWAFYFYFVPPYHGFGINDPQYLLTFAVMLTVALITANLTAGLRYQGREAVAREARTRALYELAQALSGVLTRDEVATFAERIMAGSFGIRCSLLCADEQGRLQPVLAASLIAYDAALAQAMFDASERRQLGPCEPAGDVHYLLLRGPMRTRGVLVFEWDSEHEPSGRGDLDACASVIAIALERIHYVEISQRALLRIESERLRNSLLTAISHDLRTPLAALVGLAEGLRFAEGRERLLQGVDDICDEAARLSRLVDNLLDMARLQTGAVSLRLEWQSIEEIVGCALYSLRFALQHHRVHTQVPADLPLLRCDATLIERVIANLLENAAKYVPVGGLICIDAAVDGGKLVVRIVDNGPGVEGGDRGLFDKFSRGDVESAIPGVGLGLAICRSIVEAHGGTVWYQPADAGGAAFLFSLPLIEPPPAPYGAEAVELGIDDEIKEKAVSKQGDE